MTLTADTTMGLPAALLAAVCAEPDDDNRRRRCADWLTAHGDPALGEFVAAQVALARLNPDGLCPSHGIHSKDCPDMVGCNALVAAYPVRTAAAREAFLTLRGSPYGPDAVVTPPTEREQRTGETFQVVRRGFVDHLYLTAMAWAGLPCGGCYGDDGPRSPAGHANWRRSACPRCRGLGLVGGLWEELCWRPSWRHTVVCPACHGVPRRRSTEACPWCDGGAYAGRPCAACRGVGSRPVPARPCRACNGNGRVPRPMPPTAQPVTRVTLAGTSNWATRVLLSSETLAREWPGIAFITHSDQ